MLSRRGRGSAGFFPHPGRLLGGKPPPDSTAILTKTGGADVRHTKQRTGRARTFTDTREQKRAQRKSYTRQDPGAAHARTHSGREMLQDGVTTAEGAETRTGDARPPERDGDTKGGHPHGPEAPTQSPKTVATQKKLGMDTQTHARTPGPRDPSPIRGVTLQTRVRGRQRDAHTKGLLPPSHRRPEGPKLAEGARKTQGTHPLGPTKAATPPAHRHPDPRRHTAGTTASDAGRRAHTHTHHTPTEGVWRAPLPGHLGCSAIT